GEGGGSRGRPAARAPRRPPLLRGLRRVWLGAPPPQVHAPMAITSFGSGIWLYSRRTRLAILKFTVPATIIRSACRGVARKAPAPNRSISKRDAPVAIISMAQHARPNVIGHMLDSRAQLIACSSDVVMTLSSKRPSSQPICHLERFVFRDQCPCPADAISDTGAGNGALGLGGGGAITGSGTCSAARLRTQRRSPLAAR